MAPVLGHKELAAGSESGCIAAERTQDQLMSSEFNSYRGPGYLLKFDLSQITIWWNHITMYRFPVSWRNDNIAPILDFKRQNPN
jgi:hypothetical protein